MRIFEFSKYKQYLGALIQSFPKGGRGQARRLADHLNVSSVVISQILSGPRHFTPEQSLKVAEFFGLDAPSTDYFVLLVQQARAGARDYEKYLDFKLASLRREAFNLKNRVVEHRELTENEKGIFYSNWFYSGIRLLSSLDGYSSVDAIAKRFELSPALVRQVVEFLVSKGLCSMDGERIQFGITATYVDRSSPFVNGHRRNWRIKALEHLAEPQENDVFYSGPYSLSSADAELIRRELIGLIGRISAKVGASPPERLMCLNVDWFGF
jgi:uncharacterized protein (TIGR02147 family)